LLTPGAALQRLASHYQSTGQQVSLLIAASEFCEAAAKLGGRTINEAVDGYLNSVATVKRKSVLEAVEQFIAGQEPRTVAANGKRPEVSPKYHYNRTIMLRRFAVAFPNTAVCDLTREHLGAYLAALGRQASKSRNRRTVSSGKARNHHRASIRQFLDWATRNSYLPVTHRLGDTDQMRPERANVTDVQFYTPAEFKSLLDTAKGPLQAMIALGGLAGLRTAELLRLSWQDVWRIPGHIEVTAGKSKTRQRRLVKICTALGHWLKPFRQSTEGPLWAGHEITWQDHFNELCADARVQTKAGKVPVTRKPNGLRHSFCTYHFAANGNEFETAQQAGHAPALLHAHYKGLATKREAGAWFTVKPETSRKAKAPANIITLSAAANA
jgi:integrase